MSDLGTFYARLLAAYGPQGWWPLLDCRAGSPTGSGALAGYHPGHYGWPRDDRQRFEICVGAILTQNTAWTNVERALHGLAAAGQLEAAAMLRLEEGRLAALIRPAGYFNLKASKLRQFATCFVEWAGRTPSRHELLAIWGVGPETADSMLLYAYGEPEMVVDAYTRRILGHHGFVRPTDGYEQVKAYCCRHLPVDMELYQEFHALLVEHAKRCFRRPPYADPLWP